MQRNPLVSVVTPSYNKAAFIEETILSVKNQTYPSIEHIVIDGGSTDGTLEVLRKYSNTLIWISEPDKGQSDAINKGWRVAKGEILAYLNADDTYMPSAVETVAKFLEKNPDLDMVYGDCNIIDEHSRIVGRYPAAEFDLADLVCSHNMIPQPTVFFVRRVLDKIGYLDTNLHLAMDYDFWIRIALKSRIMYIPTVLGNFRLCAGTKSMEQSLKWPDDLIYTLDKLFSTSALPKEIVALKREAYSSVHLWTAVQYHSLGQMRESRKYLAKALITSPGFFLSKPWPPFYLAMSFLGASVNNRVFRLARRLTNKG